MRCVQILEERNGKRTGSLSFLNRVWWNSDRQIPTLAASAPLPDAPSVEVQGPLSPATWGGSGTPFTPACVFQGPPPGAASGMATHPDRLTRHTAQANRMWCSGPKLCTHPGPARVYKISSIPSRSRVALEAPSSGAVLETHPPYALLGSGRVQASGRKRLSPCGFWSLLWSRGRGRWGLLEESELMGRRFPAGRQQEPLGVCLLPGS